MNVCKLLFHCCSIGDLFLAIFHWPRNAKHILFSDLLPFPQQVPGYQFLRSTNLYMQPEVVPYAFRRSINPRPTADDTETSAIVFDKKQYIRTTNCVVIVHYSPEMMKLFHLNQQGGIQKAWLWKSCQLKMLKSKTRSGGGLL